MIWSAFTASNHISEIDWSQHDDVIKWKHFSRYWPFVRGIHRSLVNSPQWRGDLMFSSICVWINGWVNNPEAGDLRRYLAHFDVIVMRVSHYIMVLFHYPRWRHEKDTLSALLALCEGIRGSPVDCPHKRPVKWAWIFSRNCLNKRVN